MTNVGRPWASPDDDAERLWTLQDDEEDEDEGWDDEDEDDWDEDEDDWDDEDEKDSPPRRPPDDDWN